MPGRNKPNHRQKWSQKSATASTPAKATSVKPSDVTRNVEIAEKDVTIDLNSELTAASHSLSRASETEDAPSEDVSEARKEPKQIEVLQQTELLHAVEPDSPSSQGLSLQSKAVEVGLTIEAPLLDLPEVQDEGPSELVSAVVTESDTPVPSPKRRSRKQEPTAPSGGAAAAVLSLDDTLSSMLNWRDSRATHETEVDTTRGNMDEMDAMAMAHTEMDTDTEPLDNTWKGWLVSSFQRELNFPAPATDSTISDKRIEETLSREVPSSTDEMLADKTPSTIDSSVAEKEVLDVAPPDRLPKLHDVEDTDTLPVTSSAASSRRPTITLLDVEDLDEKDARPKYGRASQGGARPAAIAAWWPWSSSSSAAEPADAILDSDKASNDTEQVSAPENAPDCPVCFEKISAGDAAMRCAGEAGVHHYCHKHCLSNWIKQCRSNDSVPTCPVCRGRLQINIENLATFLDSADDSADLLDSDRSMLKHLLERARATVSETPENVWAEPFTKEDVGFAGAIGLAVSAGFMAGFSDQALDDVALLAANELTASPAVSIASSMGYIAGVTTNVAATLA